MGGPVPEDLLLLDVDRWLQKLRGANTRSGLYPAQAFERCVAHYWLVATRRKLASGATVVAEFFASTLAKQVGLEEKLRLLAWAGKRALALERHAPRPSRTR